MFTRKVSVVVRPLTVVWTAAFLLVSILASSANLHQVIHDGYDHDSEHVCALTPIRDGLVEQVSAPDLVSLPDIYSTMLAPQHPPAVEPTAPPYRLPWAVGPPELG